MEKKGILNQKYYLYMTEFFAGMSVMAVELGASRLLAPYFSSSQIVWTIIIGTIMIAMALGNIWGGRQADKDPNPDKLFLRIMIAAVWIGAIPLVGKYIIIGISGVLVLAVNNNFLILAAFFACMAIFVFPLFLLGTVTPCLVKYTVSSLDDSGKTVGVLGAFQTIGSIIGTFLPTFVTIPAVGTSVTFLIFAFILLLLGIVYFVNQKTNLVFCSVTAGLIGVCALFGHSGSFAFWEKDLTYEGESIYNYLQVKETEDRVLLSTNVLFGVQSMKKKDSALTGMYYDYALAAPLMAGISEDTQGDILILGMGSGTYASQCLEFYPKTTVEGVEIDEKITELASLYFDLPQQAKVTTYDGRAFLQATDKKYDVIMVDAYQDITIPFQMSSVEFFTLVKEHLNENGVMVVNMNMQSDEEGNINDYLADTIASVFPSVYTADVKGSTNRELFAAKKPLDIDFVKESTLSEEKEGLKEKMEEVESVMLAYSSKGYLLTDDKAPVEVLGMQVIDHLIQNEIIYYKKIFKEQGLSGLMEVL